MFSRFVWKWPSAQSICTARPQSSVDQSYQWWKNSRPPRQGQSAHCYGLKMRKFDMDMPTKPTVKSGMKWKPQQAVREAELYWKHQEFIGRVCQERLGNCKTKCCSKAKSTCSAESPRGNRRPAFKSRGQKLRV